MQLSKVMATALCQAAADIFQVDEGDEPIQLVFYAGQMEAMSVGRADLLPLAILDLPSPAFGAITVEDDRVTAVGFHVPEVMAETSGQIGWWRIYSSENEALMQEAIEGGTIIVHETDVVEGNLVQIEAIILSLSAE